MTDKPACLIVSGQRNVMIAAAGPLLLEALERIASATMSQYTTPASMAEDFKRLAGQAIARATGGHHD